MIRERIKEKPLVSVIVPVYNAQEYLKQCVDSILAQTYDLLEVILVDDGSTDDSGRICDAYAEQDARVEVLHKANGGLISAWKAGVDISHGEYLAFVDSDDWIDAVMLEHLVTYCTFVDDDSSSYDHSRAEIICCNATLEYPDGRKGYEPHAAPPGTYTGKRLQEEIFRHILGEEHRRVTMSRCMKLFSREVILRNMKYCNPAVRMGEDITITLPAVLDCDRLVILRDENHYHYRYVDSSMVHQYDDTLDARMHELVRIIRTVLTEKFREGKLSTMRVKDAEIEAITERERILLFQLQLRNAFRYRGRDRLERIRALCFNEKIPQASKRYPTEIRNPSKRLLYQIEKDPTKMMIWIADVLFKMHRSR